MEVKRGSQEVWVRYVHQERKGEEAFSFSVKMASLLWLHRRGQKPERTNRTREGRGIAGIEDGPSAMVRTLGPPLPRRVPSHEPRNFSEPRSPRCLREPQKQTLRQRLGRR